MRGQSKFQIAPQTVDFQGQITIGALVDLILTTAGNNADENGFGIRDLQKLNCTWVLSRLAVEMEYMPKQYEWIYIDTWIDEVYKLNTTRNFQIRNSENKIIGQAVSLWVMINFETRRPVELEKLGSIHHHAEHIHVNIAAPLKLDIVNSTPKKSFSVCYSDIDINQHVNTVKYIQWMSDCLSLDFYKQNQLERFDVNFINEVVFGDNIEVYQQEIEENDFHFEISKEEKTACRGRLKFKSLSTKEIKN
ncbi:Acyl-ACP thioesterase [uncultured Paludibacter sp.]|uniref:Acyl-ACP thioesterase n=1 Tax=uncultured Paludibacter sp. TaxID=497635 RepID=A0A653AC77_9BACT|nr:Acyl-ACP thioesterase [uncultured Paludibacter sp.]